MADADPKNITQFEGDNVTTQFTEDEIDALGERLRQETSAVDLGMYRQYQIHLDMLREELEASLRDLVSDAEITSRTKRVETVAAKLLRRPDLPLSQVSDLAGCRIIVPGKLAQVGVVDGLQQVYDVQEADDKSDDPKFGYRAVHLDIRYQGQLMEIQVQTRNQFRWQQVSELAAGFDMTIKYGGGNPYVAQALLELSELAYECDLEDTDLPESDIARIRSMIISAYSA